MKLKILGMALLALAATSAFAVTNASGEPNGHFEHHAVGTSAAITAHDGKGTAHSLQFSRLEPSNHNKTASGSSISCKTSEYTGQVSARSVTLIQLYPVYTECTTSDNTKVTVSPNGCSYTFSSQGTRQHGTVSIDCPVGQSIDIAHPNCTISVDAQTTAATMTEGISYTQVGSELTAHVTVNTITGTFHSGICIFLGTNQKFEMKGSVTVQGFNYVSGEAKNHTLKHEGQIAITST